MPAHCSTLLRGRRDAARPLAIGRFRPVVPAASPLVPSAPRRLAAAALLGAGLVLPACVVLALVAARDHDARARTLGLVLLGLGALVGAAAWVGLRGVVGGREIAGSFGYFDRPRLLVGVLAGVALGRALPWLLARCGFDAGARIPLVNALDLQSPLVIPIALGVAVVLGEEVASRRRPAPWRMARIEEHPPGFAVRWATIGLVGWLVVARATVDPSPRPAAAKEAADDSRLEAMTLPQLERESAANPRDGRVQYRYAMALTDARRYTEALPVAERAVALLPRDAGAENLLGWLLGEAGRDAEALPHLRIAVMESRRYESAWLNYLWQLGKMGRTRETWRVCPNALHEGPRNAGILYLCGRATWYFGDRAEAMRLMKESIARDTAADGLGRMQLGMMYRQTGRLAESAGQLDTAIMRLPDMVFVHVERGLTAAMQHDSRRVVYELGRADALSRGMILKYAPLSGLYYAAQTNRVADVAEAWVNEYDAGVARDHGVGR